jgi:hypothetical protein
MPQMMALGVQSPNIDALGSFREGVAGAAGMDQAKKQAAEKSLQMIGAASMHALGGDINGQADPQRYDEGLNMLSDMGIDVEKFRGKPHLANAAARASVSTMQQLALAQDDRQFEFLMEKFQHDVMNDDRQFGLDQQKFEAAQQGGSGYRVLSPEEASSMGLPPGAYQVDGENKISPIGGSGVTINMGKEAAAAAEQQDAAHIASNIIVSAAEKARKAAGNRNFGHIGQGAVAGTMPWTDSAEVARQVEVLKSQAKIENLTAMRAASPTGGALGAVSDRENDMLAAKSGALDPNSPNFADDLDDYELTLLQVVHGPQEGTRIFQETRQQGSGAPAQSGTTRRTSSGVSWSPN